MIFIVSCIFIFQFIFFNLFFYWRIIALHDSVVFCQTSTWISHRYTYIPSLLNLSPHSTPLGWYRTPVWVSWAIQQIPVGYLFYIWSCKFWASLVAQLVKNPLAIRETYVQSLGWEGPLEKGKATHSSILAWRMPWTVYSLGSQRVGHSWEIFTYLFTM